MKLAPPVVIVYSKIASFKGRSVCPARAAVLAQRFSPAKMDRVAELFDTLTSLGKARQLEDGRFLAV